MKQEIRAVKWEKEYPNKFEPDKPNQLFKVIYVNDELEEVEAFYTGRKKEQKFFKEGEVAEFTTEVMKSGNREWLKIKPVYNKFQSNYGRAVKKEQSRYSGFAMAYAKDLVVAGAIDKTDMYKEAKAMIDWMVKQDKELGQ